MPDHPGKTSDEADRDYAEHERTYRLFLKVVKWAIIGAAVLIVLFITYLR